MGRSNAEALKSTLAEIRALLEEGMTVEKPEFASPPELIAGRSFEDQDEEVSARP